MKSLIIFAGAGASRGVSGDKYPMALDFRKRLPGTITATPLYGRLEGFLNERLGDGIDIEHILWELGQLVELLDEWTENNCFGAHLLRTNQIVTITGHQHMGQATQSQFQALSANARSLQDMINEKVYEYYSKPPHQNELMRSWIPLLERVRLSGFSRIDIFTTNYDLVIESALEELSEINIGMGFSQGVLPGIKLDTWRGTDSITGMLTKLHGSVDWKLGNGGTDSDPVIRRGHPEFDGDHRKRLILYPGFKGEPLKEPFVTFHNYFKQRLKSTTHLLFIGFAFRDEFINSLINSTLLLASKIAVINPTPELPPLPFLKNAIHLQQGFGIDKSATLLERVGVAPFNMSDLDTWINS